METKADGGKSYFYNARTRETTWTRPEEKEGVRVLTQDQVDRCVDLLVQNFTIRGRSHSTSTKSRDF